MTTTSKSSIFALTLLAAACGDDSDSGAGTADTGSSADGLPAAESDSTSGGITPSPTPTDDTRGAGSDTDTDTDSDTDSDTDTDSESESESGGTGGAESVQLIEGFSAPESAHWHAATQTWFVSNIHGETGDPDGEGWITRLDAEPAITDAQWVAGLDAPTGIVSTDDTLYVADIDRLVAIDIASAAVVETWTVKGAGLLNDPALHADGSVYVSDTFAQAVYRFEPGLPPELVVQDPQLDGPNGLHIDGDTLTIASTGSFVDFEQEAPMFRLDLDSGALTAVPGISGKFDGIEADGRGVLVTDFRGMLLRLDSNDQATVLRNFAAEGLVLSTADLGYDPVAGRVGIPDLFGSQVLFYDLERD